MADNMEPIAYRIICETWPMIDDGIIRSADYYKRLGRTFNAVAAQLKGYTRDGYLEAQTMEGMISVRDRIVGALENEVKPDVRDAMSRLVCDLSLEGPLLADDGSNADEASYSSRMLNAMATVAGYEEDTY